MSGDDVVGRALDRLTASDLLAAVVGVHAVEREGCQTALVSVASDTSGQTRTRIVDVLHGLRHEVVEVERPARAVVHGLTGFKDGTTWRIGTQSEVSWICDNTPPGLAVTSAIPPVFDAYATLVISAEGEERRADESALLALLAEHSAGQAWLIGYLDTGAHDVVFDHAPTVTLYAGWRYVLIEAGPTQAGAWRDDDPWRGRLPDLIFPADRSWLVCMLWDDDWRCLGGPAVLVRAVMAALGPNARPVTTDEDATPPGHIAR